MKNIWRLLTYIPNNRQRLVAVTLTSSLLSVIGVGTPYLFKLIVDAVVAASRSGNFSAHTQHLILIYLGILLAARLLSASFDYLSERLGDRLFADTSWGMQRQLFAHLISLSIDYFEAHKVGEIMERVRNGVMDVARWTYNLSSGILINITSLIFILIVLWVKLPVVGLILTVTFPLNLWLAIRRVQQTKPLRKDWLKMSEKANGELSETISHIATVRSFSQESYRFRRYNEFLDQFLANRMRLFQIEWRTDYFRSLLSMVGIVGSLAVVALGAAHGRYSAGDIFLVSLYSQQVLSNIFPLSRLIIDTGDVEAAAERVTELLDIEPSLVDA